MTKGSKVQFIGIDPNVNAYLIEDRQWKRELRTAHAAMQLSRAKDPYQKKFWSEVVARLKRGPFTK